MNDNLFINKPLSIEKLLVSMITVITVKSNQSGAQSLK